MWHLAWRNLRSRPTRSGLAVIGLSIPIFGVVGLLSLTDGIRDLVGASLDRIHGILVVRENVLSPVVSDLPGDLVHRLAEIPGVRVAAPELWKLAPAIEGRSLYSRIPLGALGGAPARSLLELVVIEGQDIPSHLRMRSSVFPAHMLPADQGGGRFLSPSDQGRRVAVISPKIARENPRPDGLPRQVGDTIRIGPATFEIVGLYETGSILFDMTIVMDIGTARELLHVEPGRVSCFLVEPDDPAAIPTVVAAIEAAIPEVDARSMSELNLNVGQILGDLDQFLLLVVGLALLVGTIGIVNTMLMSISERTVDFGVLRANGWSRRDILRLVATESVLLGALSGLLGCVLAVTGALVANQFLFGGLRLSVRIPLLLGGVLLSLAMGTLGGLYPAWRAARRAPMEAIRQGHAG